MVRRYEELIEVRAGEGAVGFKRLPTRSRDVATTSVPAASRDLAPVSLDLATVSLDLATVSLDLATVSLDLATVSRDGATRGGATSVRDMACNEGRDGLDDVGLEPDAPDTQSPSPSAFLWRGRLYIVREVIGHWRERRAWWRDALDPDEEAAHVPDGLARQVCLEQEVWRVEASPGRLAGTGVYDLGMSGRTWRLLRVAD